MHPVASTSGDRGQKRKLKFSRQWRLLQNLKVIVCLSDSEYVIYGIIHHSFTSEKTIFFCLLKSLYFVFYPRFSFWLKYLYYQYDDIVLVIFSCIMQIIYVPQPIYKQILLVLPSKCPESNHLFIYLKS